MKTRVILTLLFSVLIVSESAARPRDKKFSAKTDKHYLTIVNADPVLDMENKFGDITIVIWDRQEIQIEAEVTSYASSQSTAETNLDYVDLIFTKSGNTVRSVTSINEKHRKKNDNLNLEINISVSVPRDAAIVIDSKFGNVYIGELIRHLDAKINFGDIKCTTLMGSRNRITVAHGTITLGSGKDAEVDIRFGNLKSGSFDDINIVSRHSNVNIGDVKKLVCDVQFGNFKTGSVNDLTADAKHSNLTISEITNSLNITNVHFGSVKVMNVRNGFRKININGAHSNMTVYMDPKAAYFIDANSSHANINLKGIGVQNVEPVDRSGIRKAYKGAIGALANPEARVTLESKFGNITVTNR